jgi:multicomponent Na+:H+ antiporter subunit A
MNRRSLLLERAAVLLVPPILVTSLFLLFAGHNAPGGGFVGGLTAGLALAFAHAAGGRGAGGILLRLSPGLLLGIGLVIAGLTGAGGWILGQGFLDAGARSFDLPAFGTVKVTSALFFDIGVYLVVAGMVATTLDAFSDEEPS